MKSIRLSLLLYFLVLLAVALGAVSVCGYQYTHRVLDAKAEVREQFLKRQYENGCARERERLDRSLWVHAFNLARLAELHRTFPEIELLEELPPQPLEYKGYFQINSDRGNKIIWRSPSMGDSSFAFDVDKFKSQQFYDYEYDETELSPGLLVHRLSIKLPVSHFKIFPLPHNRGPNRGQGGRSDSGTASENRPEQRMVPPPLPSEPTTRPAAAWLIQCAAETTHRDEELAKLKGQLDNDLVGLAEESKTTLATLRNWLLLIGLITFAATVVGGIWLVRVGLSPLQRLSAAVGQVSAKDFRLPFDEKRLPQELRPIVERLTQTLDLLKRTFAREKQAAADISHELRTPLAALLTTIEVALRKPRSTEEYRELLADCHTTGLQMSQLIERLLALARLDAGVDNLRPHEVDASTVAEQCATLVRPLVNARGLTLRVERNGPVVLHTDPDKLREILTNLLHNAIEYNRPEGSIELALQRENGHVLLEVKDTGIGIAPEAREHIFERFYRADPSRQADGLHAGIGLAIVKGYVDLMGGTISVESTEGQGTTFRVELPAS